MGSAAVGAAPAAKTQAGFAQAAKVLLVLAIESRESGVPVGVANSWIFFCGQAQVQYRSGVRPRRMGLAQAH
jgi:hypothetical protein